MRKMNFSNHVMNVFNESNADYESIKNLMFDLAVGNEIYDAESDRVISKSEAEENLRTFVQKVFEVN